MPSQILRNSILVVAHPDDEVLWFSSILKDVSHVVICFWDELSDPSFGEQRKKSLLNFPLENVSHLDLTSIGMMRPQSFISPKFNKYGIELVGKDNLEHSNLYQENYYKLRSKLAGMLSQYQNVFTHNPWGEYGHEEHVQLYRVAHDLQKEAGFNLWYSSYCSTKTLHLVSRCLHVEEVKSLNTDEVIANELLKHYKEHKVWTWDDDWCWPATETFIKQKTGTQSGADYEKNRFCIYNNAIPLNLILMPPVSQPFQKQHPNKLKQVVQKVIRRIKGS